MILFARATLFLHCWGFGLWMLYANDEPALEHLKGLHGHWMEHRAEFLRSGLGERTKAQENMNLTEQRIREQSKLLGIAMPEQKDISPPDISSPNPVTWIPAARSAEVLSLEQRELSEPWMAHWGKSLYTRRNSNDEPQELGVLANYTTPNESSENKLRHQAPPDWPIEASTEPVGQLSLIDRGVLSSTAINLPVPSPYHRKAWWLWEKRNGGAWKKIRSGWLDMNILVEHLPEGEYAYRFTAEHHQPSQDPEHFFYRLDTQSPTIDLFELKNTERAYSIIWRCHDNSSKTLKIALTVYGPSDMVLLGVDNLNSEDFYDLLPEHVRQAQKCRLFIQDEAGNIRNKTLQLPQL